MPYLYYVPVVAEEHMLFLGEISKKYKIFTKNKNTHNKLIKTIINQYCEDNNLEIPEVYYYTSSGLSRVYPAFIYEPAITNFLSNFKAGKEQYSYFINGKNYYFILK